MTDAPVALITGGASGIGAATARLGFGAMRLSQDRGQARALLRRVVELGVRLIDTAEFYGPGTSERLIAEALHPYPEGLVIATKGLTHPPNRWGQQGNPERLREAVEGSSSCWARSGSHEFRNLVASGRRDG
jgi:aryl-alcohol dehydrogenase-like predicted oxidoreductase